MLRLFCGHSVVRSSYHTHAALLAGVVRTLNHTSTEISLTLI